MNFKNWIINESAKELAKDFKSILHGVPQSPKHHPEGDALVHTRLVRKSINQAINYINELKTKEPFKTILQNINVNLVGADDQLIKLTAFLHDIGKKTATRIKDDKITSYNHENPEHYQPQIDSLRKNAHPELIKFYEDNKELIDFLIQRHMDVSKGGFPNQFIATYMNNGVFIPDRKLNLLMVILYADKMGRKPQSQESIDKNDKALIAAQEKSMRNAQKVQPQQKPISPQDLLNDLKRKNIPLDKIINIVKNKFNMADEEVKELIQNS